MKKIHKLNIKDFSTTCGGRYKKGGKYSAEEFRDEYLYPKLAHAFRNDETLYIDLSGTYGLCASFLDEAFSGMLKHYKLTYEEFMNQVEFVETDESHDYNNEVKQYMQEMNNYLNNL